ncbi:malonyl-CoA decarboxylase [Sphingopyxis panaciterrae]|uniref:malonyl-CoA decarboxylase n=1 Tax=Sphingopyxis panaciterrae TaxID=363841 RepID=UPI001ABB398B|nr:malonyl-CoA decarboxylase [Sphingopyxis panaciterrae]NIJ35834.1 malonyl-CoA decarboxylase [Sphingopyxis panaciterrae]
MDRSSLTDLLQKFSLQGRDLLRRHVPFIAAGAAGPARSRVETLCDMARDLISNRGEASGVAIASDLLRLYEAASEADRAGFFAVLAQGFNPDRPALLSAWAKFQAQGWSAYPDLASAIEAPRQELFRRLNLAPGGTAALVRMRADLLAMRDLPGAALVEADLAHLLQSWFNRGFLTMRVINWSSPASLLERVIRYEAVHDIRDWNDLRSRLDPSDRRCYAFFHPAIPDDPLIFVEVALTNGVPDSIQNLLAADRVPSQGADATTAVFYSISNCQPGLRGISFGHFLIKQVATDLKREIPGLERFVTLSPIPGFMKWLRAHDRALAGEESDHIEACRDQLIACALRYFLESKDEEGRPIDPVARFHLGNGARLEQLNWMADSSEKGLRQSAGMMVNYLYDLPAIEELHERFANRGSIAIGRPFRQLISKLEPDYGKMMERQE